jgi:hypothetical protein
MIKTEFPHNIAFINCSDVSDKRNIVRKLIFRVFAADGMSCTHPVLTSRKHPAPQPSSSQVLSRTISW